MKDIQPVDQAALLVSTNQQRNFSIIHRLLRKGCHIADDIIWRGKVMIALLVQESSNILVRNHRLKSCAGIAVA